MHKPENWKASCRIDGPLEVVFDDGNGAHSNATNHNRPTKGITHCFAVDKGAVFWDNHRPHPWLAITMVHQSPVEFFTWGMFDETVPKGYGLSGSSAGKPKVLEMQIVSTGAFSLTFAYKEKKEMVSNLDPANLVITPMYDPQVTAFRECTTCPGIPRASNPQVTKPDMALTLMVHPRSLWKEILFEKPSFTMAELMPMLAAVGTAILKMREVLVGRGKVEDPYNPWGVVQKVFVNIRRPEVLDSKMVRATGAFIKTKVIKHKEYWKVTDSWLRKHYCKAGDLAFGRLPQHKGKKDQARQQPVEEEMSQEE